MLFSYGNRKKKFPIDFSSPLFWRSNTCNFTSGCVQNRERRENGDSGSVTSIQERCFHGFQCYVVRRKKTWSCGVLCTAAKTRKMRKSRFYIHQIPFYGDTRSEAVKRRRNGFHSWMEVENTGPRASSIRWCARCIAKKISLAHILSTNSAIRSDWSVTKLVLCPFLDFIDPKLSENIQLEIVVRIAVR